MAEEKKAKKAKSPTTKELLNLLSNRIEKLESNIQLLDKGINTNYNLYVDLANQQSLLKKQCKKNHKQSWFAKLFGLV